jgi:hypothetical protein
MKKRKKRRDCVKIIKRESKGFKWPLNPVPWHTRDSTNSRIRKLVECTRREVEVSHLATCASIGYGDRDALALIISLDPPPADRVGVWVNTVIARERVVEKMGYSSNVIGIVVDDPTRTKTGWIKGPLTDLCAAHEAGSITVLTGAWWWWWWRRRRRRRGISLGFGRRWRSGWRGGRVIGWGCGGGRIDLDVLDNGRWGGVGRCEWGSDRSGGGGSGRGSGLATLGHWSPTNGRGRIKRCGVWWWNIKGVRKDSTGSNGAVKMDVACDVGGGEGKGGENEGEKENNVGERRHVEKKEGEKE